MVELKRIFIVFQDEKAAMLGEFSRKLEINDGKIIVPVSFLSNVFDLGIEWDNKTITITIKKNLYYHSHYQSATNET